MAKGKNNKRIQLLAQGSIGSALFKLSAPAIAGMMVMAIYNIADTFFVSLLRDTTAVAATGIVFPIFQLIGSIGLTFGIGAASVISRKLGENNYEEAGITGATALFSAIGVGILFSITGAIFIKPLLVLFGATDTILQAATLYGRVIVGGSVFQVMNMCLNNILRSEGASLHSSIGQILGAITNIVLDPIFIFVCKWGITGAALATILSQGISTLYLSSYYLREKGVINPFSFSFFHPSAATYRDIMNLGIPTFVRQILGSISFGIVNNATAVYGDNAIAAISITFRLFSLFMMGLTGLAQGLQPLVGYNYGARRFDRVHETVHKVFSVAIIVGAVSGVLVFIFAAPIMKIFVPQSPDVIVMGTEALRMNASALIPTGIAIMYGGIFQALGNGRYALILAAGQQGLFLIPLVLILPFFFKLSGVFAAQPAGFSFAFLIGLILYLKQKKILSIQEENESADDE
jgi:putative MATE family efflux protein